MFTSVIEFYGFRREITSLRSIELQFEEEAQMGDVITALKIAVPGLDGLAFRLGENRLSELYKFNVNGTLYYDGMDFSLHPGDKIALLTLMTGG
jgi:molybdopterin converting factor small subunit